MTDTATAIPATTTPADAPATPTAPVSGTVVADPAAPAVAPAAKSPEEQATEHQAARRQRLDALREKERTRADARARRAQAAPAAQVQTPAQTQAVARVDVDIARLSSVDGLLDYAEERGVDAVAFGKAIRERLEDPSRQQGRKARELMDPILAEAKKELDALKAERAAILEERQAQVSQAQTAELHRGFMGFVQEHQAQAPRVVALVRAKGAQTFIDLATQLSQGLPEGAGPQAVLDTVEDYLQDWHNTLAGNGAAPPLRPGAMPTSPRAGANGAPPGNRAASDRTQAIDESAEWSRMSVEQRGKVLKQRAT